MNLQAGEAHNREANAHRAAGRRREAIEAFRAGIDAAPDYAPNYCHLAEVLFESGQVVEALAACRQALRVRPDYAEGWYSLGIILGSKKELEEAAECYKKAIALRPDFAAAHNNLGNIFKMLGQIADSCRAYQSALAANPNFEIAHSNYIMTLLYLEEFDAPRILAEMKRWDQLHAASLAASIAEHTNDPAPERRLRIGYVSSNFCDHLLARNLLPLFRHHDHAQFEIFHYASVRKPDRFTDRCRRTADVWRDILALDDEAAARSIRDDKIDLLIDLAGHMGETRLSIFARKPAPVQITFGGYPGGTGLATMDVHITDPYLDPPGLNESQYVERLFRLKRSWWCYDFGEMDVTDLVGPLPANNAGYVTFGCLNSFMKISDKTLSQWKALLGEVPNSRLLLITPPGTQAPRVLQMLGAGTERVRFVSSRPRPAYLKLFHEIDIYLDTLPYNAHTSAMDALSMGVPVVTQCGSTAVGRAGVSILTNLGLTQLIANSDTEYIQIAKDLANDLPKLAELQQSIRPRMLNSPLCDGPGFARDVEDAYREIWRQWCKTQK